MRAELHGEDPGPPTPQPELFSLYEEKARRGRPGLVTDPGPHGRVERHTVDHVDEFCPYVQILDVLVPQLGDQVVEVLRMFDVPSVEQVIAVPVISSDWVPQRSAVRRP